MYPDKKSVEFTYQDLDEINPEVAAYVCNHAYDCIPIGEELLRSEYLKEDESVSESDPMCIRIRELPKDMRVPISKLKHDLTGRLVAVSGMIRKATSVATYKSIVVFRCSVCGTEWAEPQSSIYIQKPALCKNYGECKGSGMAIRVMDMKSGLRDYQEGEIQESPEGLKGGRQPQNLEIIMRGDLTGKLVVGSKVTLNGILKLKDRKSSEECSVTPFVLEVNSLEVEEQDMDDIYLTDEEIMRVEEISKRPDILGELAKSIAPSIYGMESVKLGIILQLAGGGQLNLDGTKFRGDIHILMVGDPGVAKSQLLKSAATIATKSVLTSGKTSSAAGLTCTAQKDNDKWIIEAGAMVLANGGLACIDELNQMRESDVGALYNALEDQEIYVAKAGMTMTLYTRCSLLAAANPKYGRFIPEESYAEQLDLPPMLISRFDLIFPLVDMPDSDRDDAVARHILSSLKVSQAKAVATHNDDPDVAKILSERDAAAPISFEDLRIYIAHARQFRPIIDDDAIDLIAGAYTASRSHYSESNVVSATPRQILGMARLATASARLHFRTKINKEDAMLAVKLVEENLKSITNSETTVDIDEIMASVNHRTRNLITDIRDLYQNLGATTMSVSEIEQALDSDHSSKQVEDALIRMCRQGILFENIRGSGNYTLKRSY